MWITVSAGSISISFHIAVAWILCSQQQNKSTQRVNTKHVSPRPHLNRLVHCYVCNKCCVLKIICSYSLCSAIISQVQICVRSLGFILYCFAGINRLSSRKDLWIHYKAGLWTRYKVAPPKHLDLYKITRKQNSPLLSTESFTAPFSTLKT